jgi:hypothetical protein
VAVTVEVQRTWDPVNLQTATVAPRGGCAIVLVWHSQPAAIDAGVPPQVATAIAGALVEMGDVAFRWSGEPRWRRDQAQHLREAGRGPYRRVSDWLRGVQPNEVVISRSVSVVSCLFDFAWELQGQAVMVLDSLERNASPATAALLTRRDLAGTALSQSTAIFMAPIVDGDGALLVGRSDADMNRMIVCLRQAFGGSGVQFQAP